MSDAAAPWFTTALFAGMLLLIEVGRKLGARRIAQDPDGAAETPGLSALQGALFALLGLLVAFTFSGASARFDARQELVIQEANAIGTAYLRLDLLQEDDRSRLRDRLRKYVDLRLETYRRLPDMDAAMRAYADSEGVQGEIWTDAVEACGKAKGGSTPAQTLLLPALNEMFDIANTRRLVTRIHPPAVIYGLLFGLGLGCAFLAGYGMAGAKKRSWVHSIAFAAVTAVTVFIIIDLEYPRLGFIRVDAADQALVEVRQSMK